jgi:hypothetical protein
MNAGQFVRKRALMERESWRRNGWFKRAMQKLIQEAGAVAIYSGGRIVGHELANGQIVCTKQRFQTELAAGAALLQIAISAGEHKKPQRAYACFACLGWHLTSQNQKANNEQTHRQTHAAQDIDDSTADSSGND